MKLPYSKKELENWPNGTLCGFLERLKRSVSTYQEDDMLDEVITRLMRYDGEPSLMAPAKALLNELDGEAFAAVGTARAETLFEHAGPLRDAITAASNAKPSVSAAIAAATKGQP